MKTLEIKLKFREEYEDCLINFNVDENTTILKLFNKICKINEQFINYYYNYDELKNFIKNNNFNDEDVIKHSIENILNNFNDDDYDVTIYNYYKDLFNNINFIEELENLLNIINYDSDFYNKIKDSEIYKILRILDYYYIYLQYCSNIEFIAINNNVVNILILLRNFSITEKLINIL